jgi:hypothetical protein
MSYTMRSLTTLMPRFAYFEFLDNLKQRTVIKFLQRKTNILTVSFITVIVNVTRK